MMRLGFAVLTLSCSLLVCSACATPQTGDGGTETGSESETNVGDGDGDSGDGDGDSGDGAGDTGVMDPCRSDTPIVVMETNMGTMVVQLDAVRAPITVANFVTYVGMGFYDGTIFHRVINNFVIQGGGYEPGL